MAIAHDASSKSGASWTASASSVTWSHTCTGADRILFVGLHTYSSGAPTITGVTYNSVALTKVLGALDTLDGVEQRTELWYLVAPATGANNVVISYSGSVQFSVGAASSYTGVDQSAPIDASAQRASGAEFQAASPANNVTVAAATEWLVGHAFARNGGATLTAGTATTIRQQAEGGGIADSGGTVGTGSQTLAFSTAASSDWAGQVTAAFKEAAASGPVITGPSGTGSVLTGNGSCSTTGSTGLLWWKADASSTASDPGAGSEAGAGWTSQAVSGSGTQTVASFGALTAGTKYVHYLHVDGSSNRSTVADSSSFTVLAAAANAPRTFRPLFLNL